MLSAARPAPASGAGVTLPAKAGAAAAQMPAANAAVKSAICLMILSPRGADPVAIEGYRGDGRLASGSPTVHDPNPLEALGTYLAGSLAIVYVAFFVVFAGLEAGFGKGGDPAAAARGRMVVNFGLPIAAGLIALIVPFGVTTAAI